MKPRIKKVDGFWRCTTPDDQGIGVTPVLAWQEYHDHWFDRFQRESRERQKKHDEKMAEYEHQALILQVRGMMGACGFVTDATGNVIEDLWLTVRNQRAVPGQGTVGLADGNARVGSSSPANPAKAQVQAQQTAQEPTQAAPGETRLHQQVPKWSWQAPFLSMAKLWAIIRPGVKRECDK